MQFATLCSGIDGFAVGLLSAGMHLAAQCEQDKWCNAVLWRHWPNTPKTMDVRDEETANLLIVERPDLVAFGSPCQDLSVAGRREGLDGERSSIFYDCADVVAACAPDWVLFENVPGILSSNGGRDFATVIGVLGELGFLCSWRLLDAQYFGLAQRRKRLFLVGSAGNARCAEVLFERERLPWHPPESEEAQSRIAAASQRRPYGSGKYMFDPDSEEVGYAITKPGRSEGHFGSGRERQDTLVAATLNSAGSRTEGGFRTEPGEHLVVPGPLQSHTAAHGHSMTTQQAVESNHLVAAPIVTKEGKTFTNEGKMFQPHNIIPFNKTQITSPQNRDNPEPGDPAPTLAVDAKPPAVAFTERTRDGELHVESQEGLAYSVTASQGGSSQCKKIADQSQGVRKLTPRECERLMGFPDDWTRFDANGKQLSDSARYRMLGNAVCPPVVEWIGRRILKTVE